MRILHHSLPGLLILLTLAAPAHAADINLIGIFGSKATLMVDGGKPRTLAVGESTPEKIRLLSIATDSAVIEIDGRRETLRMGNQRIAAVRADSGAQRAVLTGDTKGHFLTNASINGVSMPFLVDTGATSVTISASAAKRANINLASAERGVTLTANGPATVYRVRFDTVKVGDITLHNIEGNVMDNDALSRFGLLGMSFLNRTDMKREGDTLTLVKRF